MVRRIVLCTAAAVVLVAGPAPARAQADFCGTLRRVIADAPNQFRAIRGHKEVFWTTQLNLPGSDRCYIDIDRVTTDYVCSAYFQSRREAEKKLESLTAAVSKCLPDRKFKREIDDEGLPEVTFETKALIEIRISIGKAIPRMDDARVKFNDPEVQLIVSYDP